MTFEQDRQLDIHKSVALNNAIAFVACLTAKERDTIWKSGTSIDDFVKQKYEFYLSLLEG